MVAGTHTIIAKIVYEHLLNKFNFKLELFTFIYGNLQPDFDRSCIDCDHTLEDSLQLINYNAGQLIKSVISIKEFSLKLGIICHLICDYFCLHHTIDYWKKDSIAHGVYEIALHVSFLKLLLKGRLNIRYRCKIEKSVELMVLKLRRKYNFEYQGIYTDINYSIIAAISICEMITYEWLKFNKLLMY